MAFVYGAVSDDRVARLERRVEMLETIILEQRNKRVWSGTNADEPAKAPKTDVVRCGRGNCECVVKSTPVAYNCDKCQKNYDGRRWRCDAHDWDACPSCVGVPAPETLPPFSFHPPRCGAHRPPDIAVAMSAPNPPSLFSASSPASLGTAQLAALADRIVEANRQRATVRAA